VSPTTISVGSMVTYSMGANRGKPCGVNIRFIQQNERHELSDMNNSTVKNKAKDLLKRLAHNLDDLLVIPTIKMSFGLWSIYEPSDESYSRIVAPLICLIKQTNLLQKLEPEDYTRKSATLYFLGLEGDLPVFDFNKWMVSHVVPKVGGDPILYLYTSKKAMETDQVSITELFQTLDGALDGGSSSRFLVYLSDGGVKM
jgi:hypothetical protein